MNHDLDYSDSFFMNIEEVIDDKILNKAKSQLNEIMEQHKRVNDLYDYYLDSYKIITEYMTEEDFSQLLNDPVENIIKINLGLLINKYRKVICKSESRSVLIAAAKIILKSLKFKISLLYKKREITLLRNKIVSNCEGYLEQIKEQLLVYEGDSFIYKTNWYLKMNSLKNKFAADMQKLILSEPVYNWIRSGMTVKKFITISLGADE